MLANPTYKQLEARLRVGALTIGQWAEVLVAGVTGLVFAVYVSPLPTEPTIFLSVVVAGAPVALSCGAMAHEWSVTDALRAQWTWLSSPRKYMPGPGRTATGYTVTPDPRRGTDETRAAHQAVTQEERNAVWDL